MARFALVAALTLALCSGVLGSGTRASAAELGCLPGRPGALLVSYARTGGFAGIRDRLRVYRGGQADLVRGAGTLHGFRLSCLRVRTLRTALVNARFSSLSPVYAPDDPFADGFIESVTYGGRTVRVLTGARPPARLARVLGLLRQHVSSRQ